MKYVLTLLAAILLAACAKKQDVTPDPATTVAGTYPLTYVRSDSAGIKLYEYNLPYTAGSNTLSGTLTARRDSAAVIFLTQTIKATGYSDQTSVIGSVRLQSNGSGYDMYMSNQKIGTADGTTLNIDEQQTDPATGTVYRDRITGRKAQ
ncbi:hypothetical protein FAES_pFAES01007 (plasmid) [Fibrella aestuarina BUZ 2]|uniref:Lipocalin-like domain-containing protein n=1 Tax=Fibrella aestuarina BUZ 2 TaxID=1166018 RepID=I0KH98_9BACT|nr:hypothetical protein [Fibrella aestuarina]CCH03501.1 hypothetical protein FAES_pFAES01007 [Fibrella aestuarina BUZ 2]